MAARSSASPSARTAVFAQLAGTGAGRVDQIVQRLTDAILLGVLTPGERLPNETQLAKRFGVALATAREGLSILRDNGLVETRRGREGGSFVTQPDAPNGTYLTARLSGMSRVDLQDLGLYYSVITAGAAAQAAVRASASDIDGLEGWLNATDYQSEGATRKADGRFHLELAVLSQSARLVREQIRLQAEFGPLLAFALTDADARSRASAYHRDVMAAMVARNPSAAYAGVVRHVDEHLARLLQLKATIDRSDRGDD
jgi:DNA-binding FadR family transcriptional regulator